MMSVLGDWGNLCPDCGEPMGRNDRECFACWERRIFGGVVPDEVEQAQLREMAQTTVTRGMAANSQPTHITQPLPDLVPAADQFSGMMLCCEVCLVLFRSHGETVCPACVAIDQLADGPLDLTKHSTEERWIAMREAVRDGALGDFALTPHGVRLTEPDPAWLTDWREVAIRLLASLNVGFDYTRKDSYADQDARIFANLITARYRS